MMSIRKLFAVLLAVAGALCLSVTAVAEITWNYVEMQYVNVDVDYSETIVEDGVDVRVETDSDAGYQFGGAWQFYENWHVFGEYSKAENDVDLRAIIDDELQTASGDFDVTRWRVGVGYGYPLNAEVNLYGRLSFDSIEFDDFDVAEFGDIGKTDDDGIGAEVGGRWAVTEPFELQGYVRYTSVGEVDANEVDEFDNDFLAGVTGRYFFTDMIGVQAGYEFGEIDTWNLSARLRF